MGCDIHSIVEVLSPKGVWEAAYCPIDPKKHAFLCEYPPSVSEGDLPLVCKQWKKGHTLICNDDRNYAWFGILAGIRDTHYRQVNATAGVPKNASKEYKQKVQNSGEDGHSHHFISLSALLAYDWKQPVVSNGILMGKELVQYITQELSTSLDASLHFRYDIDKASYDIDLTKASEHERVAALDYALKYPNRSIQVTLITTLAVEMSHQYQFLKYLTTLGYPTDNVRLCYFFDN